jgi:hypothetical protein
MPNAEYISPEERIRLLLGAFGEPPNYRAAAPLTEEDQNRFRGSPFAGGNPFGGSTPQPPSRPRYRRSAPPPSNPIGIDWPTPPPPRSPQRTGPVGIDG